MPDRCHRFAPNQLAMRFPAPDVSLPRSRQLYRGDWYSVTNPYGNAAPGLSCVSNPGISFVIGLAALLKA
jgi:hypothetical protein